MARRRLVAELTAADVTGPAVGDAAVVISELVSNAVRHATPLTGSMIKIAWALEDEVLRVAVSDGGGLSAPRLAQPPPSVPGGRGLGIVQSLSSRWGVREGGREVTVWAVVPAPRVTGPARSPQLRPAPDQVRAAQPAVTGARMGLAGKSA